ncbi:unnamed protein product, partial [marine sediment metagenome]
MKRIRLTGATAVVVVVTLIAGTGKTFGSFANTVDLSEGRVS